MSNKKNLLIYAHYYIPDTASTGQILRELAEGYEDKPAYRLLLQSVYRLVVVL